MKYIKLLILFFLLVFPLIQLVASENIVNRLKVGGNIVMIRHAYAPGNGDPTNFSIQDCSTQRNLSKRGIEQSKMIGIFFYENKIPVSIILSSEWCRCKDTAFYAFKDFKSKSFLNSFYDVRFKKNKNKQIIELKKYIKKWNGKKNLILITHYVVIDELLGVSSKSGEIIVSDLKFNVIGKLENNL